MNQLNPFNRLLLAASLALGTSLALAADEEADPHAHHHHMLMQQQDVKHSTVQVDVPNVVQLREDGTKVKFAEAINDGRPVVLNFIFTTCTAICPISSSTFMQLQHKLGKDSDKVHLVSVSIDPEQDTPARLRDYARKYHAGAGWEHYTGTTEASIAIQAAFHVYRGDKMSHDPVTFVRIAPGKPWLRIDGFTTAEALLEDYQQQLAKNN